MRYDFCCESCSKTHEVIRPVVLSGEPYACPDCGGQTVRVYSSYVPQEFCDYYTNDGKRIGTRKQDAKYLKANGRVITQDTDGWRDIKRMAKEGQRRTLLAQKGHY